MSESAPKTPINHRPVRRRLRSTGALVTTGLAAMAPAATLALDHPHKLEPATPLSQPASNHPRQTVEQFLDASRQSQIEKSKPKSSSLHGPERVSKTTVPPRMRIPTRLSEVAAPTVELQNLHPENLAVPPEVSKIMHENVVYLPTLRCSGFLIRSETGDPIGVLTAEHCSLRDIDGHWSIDKPGQTILNFDQPFIVQTGDSMDSLTTVGDITQFLLNSSSNDTARDVALGALGGHTIDEVAARYKQISIANIVDLKKGDIIYNSGWPVDQPNNPGPMKRQEFAMSVLGTANWSVTVGNTVERLNLLLSVVPINNPDGTECSWGNSGSGFIKINPDGSYQIIGTASAFNDFGYLYNKGKPQAAADELNLISKIYNADLAGYGAVCGVSYEQPTPTTSGVVIAKTGAIP